jgi:hypothetical protein
LKSPKLGAAISISLLVVYLLVLTNWAIGMLSSATPIGVAMGILVLTFPALGVWTIYRELRFGLAVERLGKILEDSNTWPVFQLELRPSGRPTKESAAENFETFKAQAESTPEQWQSWFALSLAYDACGDRPRARQAMAKAIELAK